METVSTRMEGMFVMPETRINILSSYVYMPPGEAAVTAGDPLMKTPPSSGKACSQQLQDLQQRFDAQAAQMQEMRSRRLPG